MLANVEAGDFVFLVDTKADDGVDHLEQDKATNKRKDAGGEDANGLRQELAGIAKK